MTDPDQPIFLTRTTHAMIGYSYTSMSSLIAIEAGLKVGCVIAIFLGQAKRSLSRIEVALLITI